MMIQFFKVTLISYVTCKINKYVQYQAYYMCISDITKSITVLLKKNLGEKIIVIAHQDEHLLHTCAFKSGGSLVIPS